MGLSAMAKKKPTRDSDKPAPAPRPTAFAIKGSLEWREWVEQGADHCRTDVSKLIDAALVEYLRERGYTNPPPKR
jgi:hypothetical protein